MEQLLVELAFVLLPHGVTPEKFSALAREAFIRAAAERSRLRNGRINRSKVAALTGLSRREIKRILEIDHSASLGGNHTPSERVVQGWLRDGHFLTKRGRPKLLAISGRESSFQRLVKVYGGDISPRAVLEELARSRTIRKVGRRLELRVSKPRIQKGGSSRFSRVIPVLIDGLRIASTEQKLPVDSQLFRLRLLANSETELTLLRERCQSGIHSLLHGLQYSLKNQLTVPSRRRRTSKHALNITALIADTQGVDSSGGGTRG